ncbi:MAG: TonB-dependent receptor [Cyclobacteriaceae bacterium]
MVKKGDQIPLIPKNLLKIILDVNVISNCTLGFDFIYNDSQFMRGDEANLLAPLQGYYITVFRTQYSVSKRISLFAKVYNLLNKKYQTFGQLGDPSGVTSLPQFNDPGFFTPSAPVSLQAGIRMSF